MQFIRWNKDLWKKDTKNLFEWICGLGCTVLALLFFGIVALASIVQTSVIDPKHFVGEHILYESDSVIVNVIWILLFIVAMIALYQGRNYLMKISEKQLMIGLFIYTIVLGLIWNLRVQCVPGADAKQIFDAASMFAKGDMTPMKVSTWPALFGEMSYFQPYPFQLGLVFLCEKIYRIFGFETALPLELMNVVALALLYLGLQKIAIKLFRKKGVLFILTFTLALCLQPLFMTAFPYGIIIGFSAAVWAYYFMLCFMKSSHEKRGLYLLPATACMVISVLAKYNNLIWVVAIVIGLMIYIIREKEWVSIAFAVVFALAPFMSMSLVTMHYENKAGVTLKEGVSQIAFLDMGLNESYMAPGWYNGLALKYYKDNNGDAEAATKAAKADLEIRKEKLLSDSSYRRNFFAKKILSQWNEPTYESIWVSQVKGHYYGEVSKESWLNKVYNQQDENGKPLYDGSWGRKLDGFFNVYQMLVFLMFCFAMIYFIKKGCDAETMIMVIVLLGGFLYHLLFEAKSQYCVSYFILLAFYGAYGTYILTKSVVLNLSQKKK